MPRRRCMIRIKTSRYTGYTAICRFLSCQPASNRNALSNIISRKTQARALFFYILSVIFNLINSRRKLTQKFFAVYSKTF